MTNSIANIAPANGARGLKIVRTLVLFGQVTLVLVSVPAYAWGDYAHRIISQVAERQLTPVALAEIMRLLNSEALLATPACRLESLGDASVWPDCVRSRYRERFATTAPWHYVNVPVCNAYLTPACADGQCVTGALERQIAILHNPVNSSADRLMALAWVAHLVGDIHQPLHVGENGDRGGNQVRVNFGDRRSKYGLKLHGIWDREMPEIVLADGTPSVPSASVSLGDGNPSPSRIDVWARQSWQLSRGVVYARLPQGFTCGIPVGQQDLGQSYLDAAGPVIRGQIASASVRLAAILNASLH